MYFSLVRMSLMHHSDQPAPLGESPPSIVSSLAIFAHPIPERYIAYIRFMISASWGTGSYFLFLRR